MTDIPLGEAIVVLTFALVSFSKAKITVILPHSAQSTVEWYAKRRRMRNFGLRGVPVNVILNCGDQDDFAAFSMVVGGVVSSVGTKACCAESCA